MTQYVRSHMLPIFSSFQPICGIGDSNLLLEVLVMVTLIVGFMDSQLLAMAQLVMDWGFMDLVNLLLAFFLFFLKFIDNYLLNK